MTPAETVVAFHQAAQLRDDSALGFIAEDLVQHAAGPQGRDGLRRTLATLDRDLDHPTATIHRVVAQDDHRRRCVGSGQSAAVIPAG